MRNLRNPQLERGEVRIEDIELDIKSRDDIPVLLIGLQHLYTQEALRDRLFALMDEHFLPGINPSSALSRQIGAILLISDR